MNKFSKLQIAFYKTFGREANFTEDNDIKLLNSLYYLLSKNGVVFNNNTKENRIDKFRISDENVDSIILTKNLNQMGYRSSIFEDFEMHEVAKVKTLAYIVDLYDGVNKEELVNAMACVKFLEESQEHTAKITTHRLFDEKCPSHKQIFHRSSRTLRFYDDLSKICIEKLECDNETKKGNAGASEGSSD